MTPIAISARAASLLTMTRRLPTNDALRLLAMALEDEAAAGIVLALGECPHCGDAAEAQTFEDAASCARAVREQAEAAADARDSIKAVR